MFKIADRVRKTGWRDQRPMLDAFQRSQAIISFKPDGTITEANGNFLAVVGFRAEDVVGQHHRMFMFPEDAERAEYADLWKNLRNGLFQNGTFRRKSRSGDEIWLTASYNPVFDDAGKLTGITKIATDVTEQTRTSANAIGQLTAIGRSQAVIEFAMDGTILDANQNFLSVMGYTLNEIKGRRHSMFVADDYARSADYSEFWAKLRRGEFQAAEFRRVGKNNRPVWIQASYNPILDPNGRPLKVVKYATDITARKLSVDAIANGLDLLSQGDLTGTIDTMFQGDFDRMRTAFNTTVANMRDVIVRLRSASATLKTATGQITVGAGELSGRSNSQVKSIAMTVRAMDELTDGVRANSDRAAAATEVARNAATMADGGAEAMAEANQAMDRISASSSKISAVIGLIDDIAFQTNLLALNASVEAARAGDAGRGFSVVAVEVRRLAQSAAAASTDVKRLIEASAGEVHVGSRLLGRAVDVLTEMSAAVRQNNELVSQIAKAGDAQNGPIRAVREAISQVDELARDNAVQVEETSATIGAAEAQARELDQIIATFTLSGASPLRRSAA